MFRFSPKQIKQLIESFKYSFVINRDKFLSIQMCGNISIKDI